MFCYKCGENLPDEAEFCIKCGENLKNAKEMNEITPSATPVVSPPTITAVSPPVTPPMATPATPPPMPRPNRVTPFPDDEPSNDTKKISPTVIALGAGAILLSAALLFVMVRFVFPGDKSSEEDTAKEEAVTATPETAKPEEEVVVAVDTEELYGEILETIRQVANDKNFDHTTVGLPYYLTLEEAPLSEMGYDFVDINGDDIPELFISAKWGGNFVSCYTIINGEIVSLVDSGERWGYDLLKDLNIAFYGSSGAADNSVALLHLNKNGVLEYQTYINTTYEDYMVSNSPVYDYLIAIENNEPNYSNRQIATETELAEFYRIYEGEKYQFNYTPFIDSSEIVVVPQNFSGVGFVDLPYVDGHDSPNPSSPHYSEALYCLGENMERVCFYGGNEFEYYVEDGALLICYPGCIYGFYFGYIIDPNMKEGDILRMDGSEMLLDIYPLTDDAQERMAAYSEESLLSGQQGYDLLSVWVSNRFNFNVGFLGTYAYCGEVKMDGKYEPFLFSELCLKGARMALSFYKFENHPTLYPLWRK